MHTGEMGLCSSWRRLVAVVVGVVVGVLVLSVSAGNRALAADRSLFSFAAEAKEPAWVVVNDGVMGGKSSSKVGLRGGALRFAGKVSLENNGGFASTRSGRLPKSSVAALADATALSMRVNSTGNRFYVTIETADSWYWAPLSTKANAWETVNIAYAQFQPRTRFGEPIDAASYAGQDAVRLGIMITNGKAEAFRLDIDQITANG